MSDTERHVLDFYARHPISADHILGRLERERGSLADLQPRDLYALDQDHYGGLEANERIAAATRMRAGEVVADFCAGLGGPARWFATEHGVRVTGVEFTPQRVAGARRLTEAVGLLDRVEVLAGDVMRAPLPDAGFDIVYSQEAFLHLPDKQLALQEAARVLKPGGRLCLTDWIAHRPLLDDEARTMWEGIAAQRVASVTDYQRMVAQAGLQWQGSDDLTGEWAQVLAQRRDMYTRLRAEAKAAGTPSGDESFYSAYVRLVELVQAGVLGGARILAHKPARSA